jgi:hypothetical protein
MVVPKGKVTELRFQVDLSRPRGVSPVAIDGFPHSDVDQTAVVQGTVSIAVDELSKFLVAATGVPLPVKVQLQPWSFRLGMKRHVHVQFSGPGTSTPDWYVSEDKLTGEFRVALTIRAPIKLTELSARVQAFIRYSSRPWRKDEVFWPSLVVPILIDA